MGAKSTDTSPKGFGSNKKLDQHLVNFFTTKRIDIKNVTVSGGTIITAEQSGSVYAYNVFLSPGFLTVSGGQKSIDYLVVGGGGPGGGPGDMTGGGGGGGVSFGTTTFTEGIYIVSVGGTGASNGNPSQFSIPGGVVITSGGGQYAPRSQGGTSGTPQAKIGGAAYPYAGSPTGIVNGGGGGAGAVGQDGGFSTGGVGGIGTANPAFPAPVIAPVIPAPVRPSWTPTVGPTGIFGGGGGAGGFGNPYNAPGGAGGGGTGGPTPTNGVDFTGGGAGGFSPDGGGVKVGGSGIIIVRYIQ